LERRRAGSLPARIFLVQEIDRLDHPKGHVVDDDLAGGGNRTGEHGIVGELNRRTIGCKPVLRMLE
jgi:hypothetical protein